MKRKASMLLFIVILGIITKRMTSGRNTNYRHLAQLKRKKELLRQIHASKSSLGVQTKGLFAPDAEMLIFLKLG